MIAGTATVLNTVASLHCVFVRAQSEKFRAQNTIVREENENFLS